MIGELFYLTGALVWAVNGCALVWLLFEIAVGFCCAVSLYRWVVRVERAQGRTALKRRYWAFFVFWWEHIGYRNHGDSNISGPGGYWRGVGDSLVLPKVENESPKNAG